MNGPLKMYRTRQIVQHDVKVPLPNCMYKLKNIHATSGDETCPSDDHGSPSKKSVDISEQNLQHLPEMAALIERQQKILRQLDELRQQMITLKSDLNATNGPITRKALEASFACPLEVSKLPNIIINASPTHPPYCLIYIQKLWNINITTHLHSSVASLLDKAAALSKALETHRTRAHQPVIELRLIWKDIGPNPELIISQMPIVGEVNILRYLARMNPACLAYETLEGVLEVDTVLDVCHCLVRSQTKTERNSLIQFLNKKLGKSEWLCGHSKFTIADVAASSAIKQVAQNDINQNMTKWLQRCDSNFT